MTRFLTLGSSQRILNYVLAVVLSCVCANFAYASEQSQRQWLFWLLDSVKKHPSSDVLKNQYLAQMSDSKGLERPLYDYELEAELEKNGDDNNVFVGISKTLDWSGVHSEQLEQAKLLQIAAKQELMAAQLNQLREALEVYVTWYSDRRLNSQALLEKQQLDALSALVAERARNRDLGLVDKNMADLVLARKQASIATQQSATLETEYVFNQWFSSTEINTQVFDQALAEIFVNYVFSEDTSDLSHPDVLLAKAQWQLQLQQSAVVEKSIKTQPTLGIGVGEDESESVVALRFGVPLGQSQRLKYQPIAAQQQAHALEAYYRQEAMSFKHRVAIAQQQWRLLKSDYLRWKNTTNTLLDNSTLLLEKQWRLGDIGTAEYLRLNEERNQTAVAGIELERAFFLKTIELMYLSNFSALYNTSDFNLFN
ncbi:TolC family protein [Sessilibacter sp. MAH4]